jgi:hypothetical protein
VMKLGASVLEYHGLCLLEYCYFCAEWLRPIETEQGFLSTGLDTSLTIRLNFPNSKSSGFGLSSDIYLLFWLAHGENRPKFPLKCP